MNRRRKNNVSKINKTLRSGLFLGLLSMVYIAPVSAGEPPHAQALAREPQSIMDEAFELTPGEMKELSWDCTVPLRNLTVVVSSTRRMAFAVLDEQEYLEWNARKATTTFYEKRIKNALVNNPNMVEGTFTVQVPKEGKYHIVSISNCFMQTAQVTIKAHY